MDRKELLRSPEYWIEEIKEELCRQVESYKKKNNLNKKQLAEKLGYSEDYMQKILSGDFDGKVNDLVKISLKLGKIPDLKFKDI
jgi:transcriptional regulator with XRE-family HTH domain